MIMALKNGKRKAVTLSYDDCVVFDKKLIQICDRNGLKCTFNINSGNYGHGSFGMTRESSIDLYSNSGHEVAIHGYMHPVLSKLSTDELIYEITEDRRNLENDYKTVIRGCAYPFGDYNDEVIKVLGDCGIVYARTADSTECFDFPENWLKLHPTCHHKNPRLMELARNFVEMNAEFGRCHMFYLWGHSYEFNNDDNWEIIEEFAEYIGGRKDIWYATNIEIYEYTQAYKNLHVSFDCSLVANPSAVDVWVTEGEKTYCIKAGETVKIK